MIDAAEHIGLVGHVVKQMGLRGDVAEEAYQEGMVGLVWASKRYDENKGVSPAFWLARRIRWSIRNWLNKQRLEYEIIQDIEVPQNSFWSQLEFNELIAQANKLLSAKERTVLFSKAYGYNGQEIAKNLGCSPAQVSRFYKSGVSKLKEAACA